VIVGVEPNTPDKEDLRSDIMDVDNVARGEPDQTALEAVRASRDRSSVFLLP